MKFMLTDERLGESFRKQSASYHFLSLFAQMVQWVDTIECLLREFRLMSPDVCLTKLRTKLMSAHKGILTLLRLKGADSSVSGALSQNVVFLSVREKKMCC